MKEVFSITETSSVITKYHCTDCLFRNTVSQPDLYTTPPISQTLLVAAVKFPPFCNFHADVKTFAFPYRLGPEGWFRRSL